MRSLKLISAGVLVGLGLTLSGARDASACGGTFLPPAEDDSPVTAHRMILSISTQQTTLYDEIEFTGVASSFAWVLPIKGTATVGLSADLLFSSLDQLTETQVEQPAANCPPAPSCDESFGFDGPEAAGTHAASDAGAAASSVTVTEQQQVGPYETVQLHATDPSALNDWLTSHGYSIPAAMAPTVAAYVAEQFDFLAMKLAPGKGVSAMRPVRVTTAGASPVLPLRMVAAGTGATTSITLWVIADGRWEPQNFPSFLITDSEIAWDWTKNASTYATVQAGKEAALGGRGWQTESSLELAQFSVSNLVLSGGVSFGFGGAQPVGEERSATGIYLPVGDAGPTSADAGEGFESDTDAGVPPDGGPETPDQARQVDLTTLFAGIAGPNARITRLRSDIAHTALSADLQLQASSDQSEVSNVYNPGQQIGQPQCAVYNTSCEQVGTAPRSEAAALSAAGTPGGGGCSTADARSPLASRAAFASFLGLLGFAAAGARRRRRDAR